jgi:hypothetical protein
MGLGEHEPEHTGNKNTGPDDAQRSDPDVCALGVIALLGKYGSATCVNDGERCNEYQLYSEPRLGNVCHGDQHTA